MKNGLKNTPYAEFTTRQQLQRAVLIELGRLFFLTYGGNILLH